ncbi:hypothetical protein JZO66_07750 [Enterococcus sp. DIV0242_7C1]|uniref:Uncharacterized protein n=1 Tax=Candidatus Enterococcus dunnyi TaxID=1834192 RepID=A0A200J0N5_9ENTE|nr:MULTISPECIES: hypothetical protein [unclassified Enterococcus]MBO0470436.1 hypothetical protein [Enterococcus sp. DIV0242_7C1]OUZ30200.1 hypothetical protein A5889_002488 [Enterococcus sp. 9D6_DIV0238]
MNEKGKWFMLLFLDILLFIIAMATNIIPIYFLVILLSFFIYKDGNAVLFKEYDERKKQKYEEYKLIQDAAKETIRTGKLLKKKREL